MTTRKGQMRYARRLEQAGKFEKAAAVRAAAPPPKPPEDTGWKREKIVLGVFGKHTVTACTTTGLPVCDKNHANWCCEHVKMFDPNAKNIHVIGSDI